MEDEHSFHRMLMSYLSDREIRVLTEDGMEMLQMTCDVLQGTVLDPDVRNSIHDCIYRLILSIDTLMVGFTDDLGLLVGAKMVEKLIAKANHYAIKSICKWVSAMCSEIAPQNCGKKLQYLRVNLGQSPIFGAHV